jgi:chromosomal replication initiation ATPase DnaA
MNSRAGSFQQLPFEFSGAHGLAREDVVIGASNAAAVGFVDRWPDWPSPVAVLVGSAGSGKTHLGAIWRERAGALQADRGALAAATATAEAGRPILLDDVDAEMIDEHGLFHLINEVPAAGASLMMTARRLPAAAVPG